jgi:hypothetical protein
MHLNFLVEGDARDAREATDRLSEQIAQPA